MDSEKLKRLIENLNKVVGASDEETVVKVLESGNDGLTTAIDVVMRLNISKAFVSAFAQELLGDISEITSFIKLKRKAESPISVDEADMVIRLYMNDGKPVKALSGIPNEILEAASLEAIIYLIDITIESDPHTAKTFWPYLKKKIS
ncbi:MAG: hypothetical protein WCX74_02030 [Candidatus Paceibacterota bacterium]